jgi:hypothetical protein
MVNVNGILKTVSYPLLINIFLGFIWGTVNGGAVGLFVLFLFVISHIMIGILSPKFNPRTPYFASYIAVVTFNILNYLAGTYIFQFYTLESPEAINRNMVMSVILALVVTYIYVKVKRRGVERYA